MTGSLIELGRKKTKPLCYAPVAKLIHYNLDAMSLEPKIQNYLITLSARASTSGGIVRPICLAVFKLLISSNFVGYSTGNSAGRVPFSGDWISARLCITM